jgi:hypothetical protein
MTLEFNQIVEQVYKMGAMLKKLDFDLSDKLELALAIFRACDDLAPVWERIERVRQPDIRGYRGAAPIDTTAEPINLIVPAPSAPPRATLIAADGGQVYPDDQAPVHYYLINVGIFVYHHGIDLKPEQYTFPELKFHKSDVHDRYGRAVRNRTIDDRRTVAEMKKLAEMAWERRSLGVPLMTLYDNRLMFLPGNDAHDSEALMKDYIGALVHLQDSGATLAGYIDNPHRSKRFMQLLFLMSLQNEDELKRRQMELSTAGHLEGLRDEFFFDVVLENGERSAIMVQNSPQNKEFKDKGASYEIAFFYLKVYNAYQSKIVRVDLPVWVARDPQRVNMLHSLLLEQCRLQGRNPYPYAITRADELAWVGGKDQAKLEEFVRAEVRRVKPDLVGRTLTAKARGKELARSSKRSFDMKGKTFIDDK